MGTTGISSIAALRGSGGSAAYAASKAFQSIYLDGLQTSAGVRRLPITVTEAQPGFVDTAMMKTSCRSGSPRRRWLPDKSCVPSEGGPNTPTSPAAGRLSHGCSRCCRGPGRFEHGLHVFPYSVYDIICVSGISPSDISPLSFDRSALLGAAPFARQRIAASHRLRISRGNLLPGEANTICSQKS